MYLQSYLVSGMSAGGASQQRVCRY